MSDKRALDVALVLATLPLSAPLIAGLALLVLAVDGRPVFFVQERVGKERRSIRVLKLRTMTLEEDPAQRRPTRLGAWLRQRGLDELPQLVNVLRGDMSLVGPRPLTERDAARLCAAHPPFAARFSVPPGLTGLSQACQALGAELTARLDAEYARRQSAALDVRILLRTSWMNVVGKARGKMPLPHGIAA